MSEAPASVVARARRGDAEAFAALVRHYDPGLRSLAFRLLGDRDLMDDVLQDAYLKAYRALPRFKGRSRLGTWLYRIVYNAAVDELERGRRGTYVPLDEVVDPPDPRPGTADAVATRNDLAEALARLAPEDRATVLMVDAQGFDYREAAEVLGVPEGTVASRLNRARRTLRGVLAGGRAEGASER